MTDKEIMRALRCTSTPGDHTSNCEQCPYWKKEQLNGQLEEKFGTDTYASCDIDKAGLDAADLIERLTAENADIRKEIEWKDMVVALAQKEQAGAEAERDALREKQRWIPVTERLPEELVLVNVVWVNRAPEPYYERIKNVPFSGTACFYRERWWWDSPVVLDLLGEYGKDDFDLVDEEVKITHWMPLPKAPEDGNT